MKFLIVVLFFSGCLMLGCKSNKQGTELLPLRTDELPVTESTDLENTNLEPYSWVTAYTVKKMPEGKAHSGQYVSVVDSVGFASYGYKEKFGNIAPFSPALVSVSGWVYLLEPNKDAKVILATTESVNKDLYLTKTIGSDTMSLNTWHHFAVGFTLDQQFEPNARLSIYAFGGKKRACFDDFTITFK